MSARLAALAPDTTVQINLSPGDVAYAELCVPPLVAAHRASVARSVAVVDLCKPQRTKAVDPSARWPGREFDDRVEAIVAIAERLRAAGHFDDVHFLRPGAELFEHLSDRYLAGHVHETHDYGGTALMAYFAAIDLPPTRYVVHYDGDMLLHQAPGFDWSIEARRLMVGQSDVVAASPRVAPPFAAQTGEPDAPSLREGLPFAPVAGGWTNSWFSTRCFMIDRARLGAYLPLVRGRMLVDTLARKLLRRGHPRSPEIMLHRSVGLQGGLKLNLSSERAWLLHPLTKPARYLELLPRIIDSVSRGEVPDEQRGIPDVELGAWESFLAGVSVAPSDRVDREPDAVARHE